MTKQTIVMINGRPYDAATGMLVDQSTASTSVPPASTLSPAQASRTTIRRPSQRSMTVAARPRPTTATSQAKTTVAAPAAKPVHTSTLTQKLTETPAAQQAPITSRRRGMAAASMQPTQVATVRSRRSVAKPAFLSPSAPSKPQAVATLGHTNQIATKKQPAAPAKRATTSRQQQIDHQAPVARQAIAAHQPTAPQPKAIRHTPVAQASTAVAKPTVQQNISRPLPKPKRLKTLPHYAVAGSTMPPKQALRGRTVRSPKPVATYAPAQQPKQPAAQPQRSTAPTSLEAELLAATEEYMRRAHQPGQTGQAAVTPAAPQQKPASLTLPAATQGQQPERPALPKKHVAAKSRKTEKPARRQQSAASKFIRFSGLAVAGMAVLLLGVYMLYTTVPGVSTQVAAAQTGVAASYPTYRPEGYDLTGPITAKDGKVAMTFGQTGGSTGSYTIMQEKTDQESDTLGSAIKKEAGHDPAITRIDGLTIYTYNNGNAAAWINKNVLYTIKSDTPLTSTQVQQIATSM